MRHTTAIAVGVIIAIMVCAASVFADEPQAERKLPAHPTERTLAQLDLTAPYDVPTVDELSEALLGEMKPLAAEYLAACERYGVNVWAVVAKDSLESGYNTSYAATVLNNLGG